MGISPRSIGGWWPRVGPNARPIGKRTLNSKQLLRAELRAIWPTRAAVRREMVQCTCVDLGDGRVEIVYPQSVAAGSMRYGSGSSHHQPRPSRQQQRYWQRAIWITTCQLNIASVCSAFRQRCALLMRPILWRVCSN